jgi:hypothetical protein
MLTILFKMLAIALLSFSLVALGVQIGNARVSALIILVALIAIAIFPGRLNQLAGLARNIPFAWVRVALVPAILMAIGFSINPEQAHKTAPAAAAPVPEKAAPLAPRRVAAPATAAPAVAVPKAQVPEKSKDPASLVSWKNGKLYNNSDLVLVGVTLDCTLFYNNGKVADTSSTDFEFKGDFIKHPIGPGADLEVKPEFDYDGSKNDIAYDNTTCQVDDVEFPKANTSLPLHVSVRQDRSDLGPPKLVGTLKNRSAKNIDADDIEVACLLTSREAISVGDQINYALRTGNSDGPTHRLGWRYYEKLKVRPYYAKKDESSVEVPAGGEINVRLFTDGGFFGSDSEADFSADELARQSCWILK